MRWVFVVLLGLLSATASAQQSRDASDDSKVPVYWSCDGRDVWGREMCAEIGAHLKASGRVRFLTEPDFPAIVVVCGFAADGPRERERLFGTCGNDVYIAIDKKEVPAKQRRLFYSRHEGAKAGRVELAVVEALAAKHLK